jgi:hypothetical protein
MPCMLRQAMRLYHATTSHNEQLRKVVRPGLAGVMLRSVNGETHLQKVYQARVSHNKQLDVTLCPGPVWLRTFATKKLVNVDLRSRVCRSERSQKVFSAINICTNKACSWVSLPFASPMKAGGLARDACSS